MGARHSEGEEEENDRWAQGIVRVKVKTMIGGRKAL